MWQTDGQRQTDRQTNRITTANSLYRASIANRAVEIGPLFQFAAWNNEAGAEGHGAGNGARSGSHRNIVWAAIGNTTAPAPLTSSARELCYMW